MYPVLPGCNGAVAADCTGTHSHEYTHKSREMKHNRTEITREVSISQCWCCLEIYEERPDVCRFLGYLPAVGKHPHMRITGGSRAGSPHRQRKTPWLQTGSTQQSLNAYDSSQNSVLSQGAPEKSPVGQKVFRAQCQFKGWSLQKCLASEICLGEFIKSTFHGQHLQEGHAAWDADSQVSLRTRIVFIAAPGTMRLGSSWSSLNISAYLSLS